MRLVFTMFFSLLLCSFSFAQINEDSPFPADFVVDSPASIAGVYDYGTQVSNVDNAIWGTQVTETMSGELIWAFSADDSLACASVVTDLTGKFAFIRRGVCGFSDKCLNAQNAGAVAVVIVNHYDNADDTAETIFGMLGGEIGADVTIPAIFVNRATGELISAELDSGEKVDVTFRIKSFYEPISAFSYQTPLSEAQDVNIFQINYINPNAVDMVAVTASATITAPSGTETVLTGSSDVAPLADSTIQIDDTFTPTELGEHTIAWTHDQSAEEVQSAFVMTEYTFSVAREEPTLSIGPTDDFFTNMANFRYQVGALVLPGSAGAVASYASFGIGNAEALFTGDAEADLITILLYNGDADEDGNSDLIGASDFNDLTPVAFAEYIITGEEGVDELIYVELEDLEDGDNLVDLMADGVYYIVIAYDGANAGIGVSPRFLGSRGVDYLAFPTTPVLLDDLYTGWNDGLAVAVQLHLDGFVAPVSTEEIVPLSAAKVSVVPNPVQSELNVSFELDEVASKVNIGLLDVNGKTLSSYEFTQVYQNNIQIDVNELPAGVYFLSIVTPEGYRSLKIVKI